MIATLLFLAFLGLMFIGVPIGAALGLAGAAAIALAAKGVAFLGKERYEFLHGAVYDKMGEKFWEMCVDCDRLEAMEVQNAKDLENMAEWLHQISGETINQIVHYLQFNQIPIFLGVALD